MRLPQSERRAEGCEMFQKAAAALSREEDDAWFALQNNDAAQKTVFIPSSLLRVCITHPLRFLRAVYVLFVALPSACSPAVSVQHVRVQRPLFHAQIGCALGGMCCRMASADSQQTHAGRMGFSGLKPRAHAQ